MVSLLVTESWFIMESVQVACPWLFPYKVGAPRCNQDRTTSFLENLHDSSTCWCPLRSINGVFLGGFARSQPRGLLSQGGQRSPGEQARGRAQGRQAPHHRVRGASG